MADLAQFSSYVTHLSLGLGHLNRHAGLRDYCTGLMSPLKRKSVEPMASHLAPTDTRARHQSLHHFVAASPWSDEELLRRVAQWVVPAMDFAGGGWWIVDDTGFPKQGKESVGVARQYCGMLGKQDSCQVAVSVSLACQAGSLPVAWQLYLPKEWAEDLPRRKKVGVPETIAFATKPDIALAQIKHLVAQGAPKHCVLADAAYGSVTAFREGLTELGLPYGMGISSTVTVWPPGHAPLPAPPYAGRGIVPTRLRLGQTRQERPVSVRDLSTAMSPEAMPDQWHTVTWREASNVTLRSRFCRIRVRAAHREHHRSTSRPQEWLLMEWPEGHKEPMKYWLSTLPEDMGLERMVFEVKMRWRVERDYQDLKQEVGLGHFEGRGWRGFHHHASLSIAAYGFLMAQHLREQACAVPVESDNKKNGASGEKSALPRYYKPRGSPPHAAPRPILDHDLATAYRLRVGQNTETMPVLSQTQPTNLYLTQYD